MLRQPETPIESAHDFIANRSRGKRSRSLHRSHRLMKVVADAPLS
jgi:hypothetical protein